MADKNRETEAAYRYWLHNVQGIGEKTFKMLVEEMGGAKEVYNASEKRIERMLKQNSRESRIAEGKIKALLQSRKDWKVEEKYGQMAEKGISMVSIWDVEYPLRLKKIAGSPAVLYYMGKLPGEERTALAVIGARECSEYGVYTANAFGKKIGEAGIDIISGMARGIDGISQRAALDAGGRSYAVLGCGADICYPASNSELYGQIRERGGIISPFPPGTPPRKNLFPYRNRIVAGLSDGVLVIEARQKSGTWITVDMALEQGKDVYAVPGRITDRLSDGCNLLIQQGAGIALTPEDVISELAILRNREGKRKAPDERMPHQEKGKRTEAETAEETENKILDFLDFTPKSSDEILELTGKAGINMTLPQLLFELIQLCMEGKAGQVGGNYFVRKSEKG